MALPSEIALTTSIAELPGIGPRRAAGFRHIGLRCVADLILHVPFRYEQELGEHTVGEVSDRLGPVHGSSASLAVRGEIHTAQFRQGRRPRFEATLFDGSGTMLLTWFNAQWMRHKLHPGMVIRAWGKTKRHGDYLQLVNPKWEAVKPAEDVAPRPEQLRPVYRASEEVSSDHIYRAVDGCLDAALAKLHDHLHDTYRDERALPTLADAYRMVHRPRTEDEATFGRRRLAFDELLLLQLGVMLKRRQRAETNRAILLARTPILDQRIRERIPFDLTPSQNVVVEEIARDLARPAPMNRLLQGDVGSGKTVVALYAMLLAVAAGHQAALMAPTELLAEQHLSTITDLLSDSRVRIELWTGSLSNTERSSLDERLAAGEVDLAIGTHALLSDARQFKSLAVVVIDEQHRFGVQQRAILRSKAEDDGLIPHTLIMTATPIPRTMSLTVFGDLDVSTIRGFPPGRLPTSTRHMPQARAGEVYRHLADRLKRGEQAYIVVPAVEDSETGLKDVQTHHQFLEQTHLAGLNLAMMHGRMKRPEREEIMNRFRRGEIDALIATTVIEVGVDVPNATTMIIEHADRFGLAQLHQLRGRVGRGTKRSLCVLIADPVTEEGTARLEAITTTSDGFAIAERDLEIRGPGEIFGTRQSGLPPFRVAEFPRDLPLLDMAHRDASTWIEDNPKLAGDRDALLHRRLFKAYGESLGLVDIG